MIKSSINYFLMIYSDQIQCMFRMKYYNIANLNGQFIISFIQFIIGFVKQQAFGMEGYLKQIQAFQVSPQCMFKFKNIDYPTSWQQQFILSYFNFVKILQKPHTQIIRQLQSDRNFVQVAQGFIYMLLLDGNHAQRLQQYIMVLRTETCQIICQQFQILLSEHGQLVKHCYQINFPLLFNILVTYRMSSPSIIYQLSNFINFYDPNPEYQKVIKALLINFNEKIKDDTVFSSQQHKLLFIYLFPKVIKISPFSNQQICSQLLTMMWQKYEQHMDSEMIQNVIYIVESSGLYQKIPIVATIWRKIKQTENSLEFKQQSSEKGINEQIYFSVLPRRTQNIIHFILSQKVSQIQLKYQLEWLQKSWQYNKLNYLDILVDMAKWVSLRPDPIEQKLIILQWVCKKLLFINKQSFQRAKRAIFYSWFTPNFCLQSTILAVALIKNFLFKDIRMSIQLLNYVFKFRTNPNFQQRIRIIFSQSIKLGYFKQEFILENRLLLDSVQQSFRQILHNPQIQQKNALKFNPELPNKQKPKEDVNYNEQLYPTKKQFEREQMPIAKNNENLPQAMVPQPKISLNLNMSPGQMEPYDAVQLILQQQFVSHFDTQQFKGILQNMLDAPSYENFVKLFKTFTKLGLEAQKDNKQFIKILVQELAKIVYCAFNNEFEDLKNPAEPQKSFINYITSILLKQWNQPTYKTELVKKLVKKINELFPTGEVAFWYYFIMQFQYGGASNRDYRNWLIPRQKSDFVIPAVEILLGQANQNFRRRASKYQLK